MTSPRKSVTYKPFSIMEGAAGVSLGPVTRAVLFAAVVMLFFGSKALLNWANNLPISSISDFVLYLAQAWQDWMDKIGAPKPADVVNAMLLWLQALRWQ